MLSVVDHVVIDYRVVLQRYQIKVAFHLSAQQEPVAQQLKLLDNVLYVYDLLNIEAEQIVNFDSFIDQRTEELILNDDHRANSLFHIECLSDCQLLISKIHLLGVFADKDVMVLSSHQRSEGVQTVFEIDGRC